MKSLVNRSKFLVLALLGALVAPSAFAGGGGPDYSALSDAIDFEAISPIVLAAGAALVTLFVIIKGVKIVLGMVRS